MSEYKDRGIMKWAPFDALNGHTAIIEEMIFNLNKKQKRIISTDDFDEFNITIKKAIADSKTVSIDYFNNGYTYTTFGKIKSIDPINKTIKLDTFEVIDFDSIMRIKMVK